MSGIRVSDKHGLNPGMDVCFWCGNEVGVVMYGRMKNDAEAPRAAVTSLKPCDECKANMAKGITFMEATVEEGKPRPTGRWSVVTVDATKRIITDETMIESVLRHRKTYLEPETYNALFANVPHEET